MHEQKLSYKTIRIRLTRSRLHLNLGRRTKYQIPLTPKIWPLKEHQRYQLLFKCNLRINEKFVKATSDETTNSKTIFNFWVGGSVFLTCD